MNKPKHVFRIGDVVMYKKKPYVVSGTRGWIHKAFKREDGKMDKWISITQEVGATSLLTWASECKLLKKREDSPKEWWTLFIKSYKDGEK